MKVTFYYDGTDIIYQSTNMKEKITEVFQKCRDDIDINSIIFLYNENQIDGNLQIKKIITDNDKERKEMNLIILDKDDELKSNSPYPKDIICPKCGESSKLYFNEYKIIIQCIKGHNTGNIFLNEYKDIQNVDLSKIICDECKTNNKNNSYNNIFYKCNDCKKNLCITCRSKHDKKHNCVNYDYKNFICEKHNEKYASYCKKCNKNICLYCKNEHKEHEIVNYENILPKINEIEDNLNILRNNIDEYKGKIDTIINKLNNIKENMEYYYDINKSIYEILNNKYINYVFHI